VRPRAPDPPGSSRVAGLHLAGLSGLAVAQPLFDLLSRNAEFFAVRGSSRWDIVLFALGAVILPALAFLVLEALAGLADARAATAVHLTAIGLFVSVIVLQAIRGADASSTVLVVVAVASGLAAAILYTRARVARMLVSVLGLAPLVFVGLFLFASPVTRLIFASPPKPLLSEVSSNAPVVIVQLDEFPTVSLMDASGEIDAVRYPNFARLARDATWFRNATTVHEWTTAAVPAILTGLFPRDDELPLYLDHPENLFTLLGGSYRLRVFESQTHLCPAQLCDEVREPLGERLVSLVSDLSVVYGHLVLPKDLTVRLPSISTSWRGYGGDQGPVVRLQTGPENPGSRPAAYTGRDAEVRQFISSLEPGDRPTLWFHHFLLPHHPWEYLPDGKAYASDLGTQPGMVGERWVGDPQLAIQGQQRHLLQVGYVDLVLGRILDRLHRSDLYGRSLIVVLADHGTSFRPNSERRRINTRNIEEIAFIPLFVKAPGQTAGLIVDDHARTIDVLPTIADILGVQIPWRMDGHSLLRAHAELHDIVVHSSSGEIVTGNFGDAVERRQRVLERQIELFGQGNEPPGLFAIGPRPDLLGRRLDGPVSVAIGGPTFESYGETLYDPHAALAPVRVYGEIHGAPGGEDIAIAVNGRIVATTRSFEYAGKTLVSAVAPEKAFRPGENRVRLYLATGSGSATVLKQIPTAS
jgi:hypothetical protein